MQKAQKKKRITKQPLSREKVLEKAISLADKDGVERLSMRKLAQALKVEAMSLYNHVKNKDDLLDAMVDKMVIQFELPDEQEHWKSALRSSVITTHKVLLKHPWVVLLLLSRVNTGAVMMSYSNACYGCLFRAGFSHALTDHGWNALHNHLYGFTLSEINSPLNPKDYSVAAKKYLPMVPEDQYPHVHSMMLVIIDGTHNGVNDFSFGLDIILDGLENKLV